MAHPLVEQLRFARSEFERGLTGVTDAEARRRFPPMNCISWMIGHLAWQEQRYWLIQAQGRVLFPELNELFAYGRPACTPPVDEAWTVWREVTAAADPWLDNLTTRELMAPIGAGYSNVGTYMLRTTYHYWYHLGEGMAVRQMLGHTGLPDFVGDIDTLAPYHPAPTSASAAGNSHTILIRSEQPDDVPAIRAVLQAAFPGPDEARLVDLLRQAGKASISLVAEVKGQVAGHVLFSPVCIQPQAAGKPREGRAYPGGAGLGPLAVHPEFQNQGLGSRLVREGLRLCQEQGFPYVVVLGHPNYYSRFGFQRALDYNLENEYGADEPFRVIELQPGILEGVAGLVKYEPEFASVS